MNIISHSYSHVITCFLFSFQLSGSLLPPYLGPAPQCMREAAMHLPALGLSPYLSPVPQCTREAAMHLPALGLSPYLDPTSQCHAGSCFASSCSRAFALSKTRKIQLCLQAANLDFSCFWHCSMLTDIIPHWRYFLIAVYRFLFSYYFLFCIILLYQEVFYEF